MQETSSSKKMDRSCEVCDTLCVCHTHAALQVRFVVFLSLFASLSLSLSLFASLTSMRVSPGRIRPRSSARWISDMAGRSLTEPAGLVPPAWLGSRSVGWGSARHRNMMRLGAKEQRASEVVRPGCRLRTRSTVRRACRNMSTKKDEIAVVQSR